MRLAATTVGWRNREPGRALGSRASWAGLWYGRSLGRQRARRGEVCGPGKRLRITDSSILMPASTRNSSVEGSRAVRLGKEAG